MSHPSRDSDAVCSPVPRQQIAGIVRRALITGAATALASASFAAAAADPAADQAAAGSVQEAQLQEVVVTGSMIERTDDLPTPVQTITAADIANSGATSVGDVLHQLTANGQGNLNQSFSGAFAAGASGIALRDMTVDATLVMIDGHRMANYPISDDGQRSFVDVANLPLAAIDHVEILKDGASAVYGSDAIAGVINIILKKTFVGEQVSAEFGTSQFGDATTYHASATYGFGDLASDGQNTYVNVEWRHQDPLSLAARPKYSDFDYYDRYGGAAGSGAPNAPGTAPEIPFGSFNAPSLIGTIAPYIPAIPATPTTPATPASNGAYQNLSACTSTYTAPLGTGCGFNQSVYYQIQPETTNVNVLVRHTMDLTGGWTGIITASLFDSQAEQLNPPSNTIGETPATTGAGFNTTSAAANPILLPIGNVNNPYPNNEAWLGYTFGDVGPTQLNTTTDMYRIVADVNGSVGNWDISTSAGYMFGETLMSFLNYVTFSGLNSVINANATSQLEYVEANATTKLFTLPGGPLGFAFGGGLRHDGQSDPGQPGSLSGNVMGEGTTYINGTESNENVHAEFSIPVVKQFEIDPAVRFDNYASVGSSTNPGVMAKFTPITQVTIRGSYQDGFRAPGPGERGNSGVTYFEDEGDDPARCPTTHLPTDCGSGQIAGVVAGNSALKPETSRSYTFGIVLKPLPRVSLSADYWAIRRTNEIIGGVGAPTIIRGPVQSQYPTVPGPELVVLAPYENVGSDSPKGIDLQLLSNWPLFGGPMHMDVNGTYTHLTSQVYCGFNGNPTTCADVAGTHGPTGISGDTGTPQDRINATIDFGTHDYLVGLMMNYVSGMTDTDPLTSVDNGVAANTCLQAWFPGCKIEQFVDFGFFSHWQVTPHWLLSFNVLDVFNQSAPLDPQAAYTTRNYDNAYDQEGAIGRFFQVGFQVKY
jgi:iron complex outermembrane receptor protein